MNNQIRNQYQLDRSIATLRAEVERNVKAALTPELNAKYADLTINLMQTGSLIGATFNTGTIRLLVELKSASNYMYQPFYITKEAAPIQVAAAHIAAILTKYLTTKHFV